MAQFKSAEVGEVALVRQNEDGRILQIALTEEQNEMLKLFLSMVSKEQALVQMPEEYDLVLKSSISTKRKFL
jgi:putative alpha-1,2-mannosidase